MSATNAIKRVEDSILALHGEIEDESVARKVHSDARKQTESALARLIAREAGIPLIEEDEDDDS